jgi:hypothetical protein
MTTDQTTCPNCTHPHHLPGTECQTPVHHGPNHWHLCLCLARPGAALSCPPQMTCQGGTLGYADVWYLQHGHTLLGEDGEIAPAVFETGVASVGFPSGPDIAAAAVSSAGQAPATDQAALRDRIADILAAADGWKWAPGFKAQSPTWHGYQERAAAVVAVLPAPTDPAAVLREAADQYARLVDQNEAYELAEHGEIDHESRLQYEAVRDVVTGLRRMAVEAAVPGRPGDDIQDDEGFVPPAALGLPAGTLEAAEIGANRLDAWARTPRGRNFLAHALVQLARTGWLRSEPGDGWQQMTDDAVGGAQQPKEARP